MKLKKYQENNIENHPNPKIGDGKSIEVELNDLPNDLTRSEESFLLPSKKKILKGSLPTKVVLLGDSGKGKSYSTFSLKYNLYDLTDKEKKMKLSELSTNLSISETDRDKALELLEILK